MFQSIPYPPEESVTIALPSLIHRIGGTSAKLLKAIAAEHGCEMGRVRRSRHWQISAHPKQIHNFLVQAKQTEFNNQAYFVSKIDKGLSPHAHLLESLEDKLLRLISANPSITLHQLVDDTNCTTAEARHALHSYQDSML